MHDRVRPSWQLRTQERCRLAVQALRVRDLCGLRIPVAVGHPPRIDAVDDAVAGHLSTEERAQAGALWPGWWRTCLVAEYVRLLRDGPWVEGVWREDLNQALGGVGEGPDFTDLSRHPALQRAAQVTWRADHPSRGGPGGERDVAHDIDVPGDSEGASPGEDQRGSGPAGLGELRRDGRLARPPAWSQPNPERGHIIPEQWHRQWQVTSAVAEQVMSAYAVPAPRVQAWLLQVPGSSTWWQLVRPGVVLATRAATDDAQALRDLLWEAFTSRLDATGT